VNKLKQFLDSVYRSIEKRADSYLELALALAASDQLESVVSLSKSPLYGRKFASVYETLGTVEINEAKLALAVQDLAQARCAELAGIAVFGGDSTFIQRAEAKTLKDRSMKRLSQGELASGYETYWSMRFADEQSSWAGVVKVQRMRWDETVSAVAKAHLQALDLSAKGQQLYVLDAGHGQDILAAYPACQQTDIVMRVKSNQCFYFEPESKAKPRGRPQKHGLRFKLDATEQPEAEAVMTTVYKGKSLRISSWSKLHYQAYSEVKGRILKLEFLDEKAQPIFAKPLWLFTTNLTLQPDILARAYLWRSSQELTFRFCKQHLGLKLAQSPELHHCEAWLTLVALAMNSLLAAKDQLQATPDPWYPRQALNPISQRQAQKQALAFFLTLDLPTLPPRPAGKGRGRLQGFKPTPRPRYPVLRKTPQRTKSCKICPLKLAA
jgi:Transposase DDE domain